MGSAEHRRHASFSGRLVVVGLGSVGKATLPLVLRHLGVARSHVTVVEPAVDAAAIAEALGVRLLQQSLTAGNHRELLGPLVGAGDFLLNLSVDVSSVALMHFCRERGALYLDACTEPWPGRYDNPGLPLAERTNYALREEALALRHGHGRGPTACLTQGANPGLVSAFAKQALLNMASEVQLPLPRPPSTPNDWAALAHALQVRVIHVAERDTQGAARRKRPGEFVNTWSVVGFVDEGRQPSELGWGTHERHWPADARRHDSGCGAAIYLQRPGFATRVRSWTPRQGPYHGFLVTHAESISLADHLTLRDAQGGVAYRPTVHYAYHPCDDAVLSLHELAGRDWILQPQQRILRDEITEGMDELGVLLMGHPRGVYWYGSRLTIERARALAPYSSATSLQVAAGVLAAMVWALRHPQAGIVEPDDMDHETMLAVAGPYLGELAGAWSDWTPLKDRSALYPEPADRDDPWQFVNFRVA